MVLGSLVDSGYADLYHSPNGDLYAFYTSDDGSDDRLVYRKREAGNTSFGDEVEVWGFEARRAYAFFTNTTEMVVSAEALMTVRLYNSHDGGDNWINNKTYAAADGIDAYFPSVITNDTNQMHLWFNYYNTPPYGGIYLYYANLTGPDWSENSRQILVGADRVFGQVKCAFEEGDDIALITAKNILVSSDDGGTFTKIRDQADTITSIGGCKRDSDGDIYLIHNPTGYTLRIHNSTNFGVNWSLLASFTGTDNPVSPTLAVDGDNIIAVWGTNDGNGDIDSIEGVISTDGGTSWTDVATFLTPAAIIRGDDLKDSISLIANNDVFDMAYSFKSGSSRAGINISTCIFNEVPTLTSPAVSPSYGVEGDNFTFSVVYTDADNQQPSWIRVEVNNTYYNLTWDSGDYDTGATYTKNLTLGSHGVYSYLFRASDGNDNATSASRNGPSVTSPSDCSVSNPPVAGDWIVDSSETCQDSTFFASTTGILNVSDSTLTLQNMNLILNGTWMILDGSSIISLDGARVHFTE